MAENRSTSPLNGKLLILDLDETLVHATANPLAHLAADFRVGFFSVYERSNVRTFLSSCADLFTVAVWTSGSPDYAQEIVAQLWGERASDLLFVWASDRGSQGYDSEMQERYPRKNLTKVRRRYGWPLESVLVVDDTPQKWEQSYGNLVRVSPFEGDPTDDELPHLLTYLKSLRDMENVRAVEKRGWKRNVRPPGIKNAQRLRPLGVFAIVFCG